MKNTGKLWGAFTLVTVLVVMLVSCPNTGGGGGGGAGGGPPPDVIYLRASRWNDGTINGEEWISDPQIKLSDFTTVKPKQNDILQFKISGESDIEIKYARIQIYRMRSNDWSTYKWLGQSDFIHLPDNFNNNIDVYIFNDPGLNFVFYISFQNALWTKYLEGDYMFNNGEVLPTDTPDGTIMATIRNFKISLESVSVEN